VEQEKWVRLLNSEHSVRGLEVGQESQQETGYGNHQRSFAGQEFNCLVAAGELFVNLLS